MTINIGIKANVNKLTFSEILELISLYQKSFTKKSILDNVEIMEFKNLKFEIKVEVDLSINFTITEIDG